MARCPGLLPPPARGWYDPAVPQTMELWIVGAKFLLLAYVLLDFVIQGRGDATPVLLLGLAFVSVTALRHLVRHRPVQLSALAVSLLVPAGGALAVGPSFVVLIPLAAAELTHVATGRLWWTPFPAFLVTFFVGPTEIPAYVLSAALSILIYVLAGQSVARLRALQGENERLRLSEARQRERAARSETYEEHLTQLAQLEERNRLAAEVHDHVGHAITGSLLQLEAAEAVIEHDPHAARGMLNNSTAALREGMDSIRAALRATRPAAEQIGLGRLRAMLDRFAVDGAISSGLTHTGDLGAIRPMQWRIIEDNLRECLTNALRHSQARSLRVNVQVHNRIARVEARDDGRGAGTVRKGIGIAGMEERTERAGGRLIVDGSRGFSVITVLPLGREG